jgi:hypothetical protein
MAKLLGRIRVFAFTRENSRSVIRVNRMVYLALFGIHNYSKFMPICQ